MNYFNYKYDEVLGMKAHTFNHLIRCMDKARAADKLDGVGVSAYPHLTDKARNKYKNALEMAAKTDQQIKDEAVTTEDLQFAGIKVGSIADHIKGK